MKPVGIDFFGEYRFAMGLKASADGKLCYSVKRANIEKNRYDTTLWLYHDGKKRRLAAPQKFSGYWWQDNHTLLLATPGGSREKKWAAAGLSVTVLSTLGTGPKEKPKQAGRLFLSVKKMLPLGGGRFLMLAGWSAKNQQALNEAGGDADKAAKLLKKQSGWHLLTELPFWANGSSFTSDTRTRLYLWDGKTATPLTDEKTEVSEVRLSPSGKTATVLAYRYQAAAPTTDTLMCLDTATLQLRPVAFENPLRCQYCVPISDEAAILAAADMKKYGINQNPAFYRVSLTGGAHRVLENSGQYGLRQAVTSDLAMSAEFRAEAAGDVLYFTSTDGSNCHLYAMDTETGEITQVSQKNGGVREAAISGGQVYVIAMRGLAGQELYRLEPGGGEKQLTRYNSHIEKQYTLAQPQPCAVTGARGGQIYGWVLRPPHLKAGERCPGILNIHGGPRMAYGDVVFHEMQYWAAKGFAVFFCNPTGGDGRGDTFGDIRGEYGGVDYEDLMLFCDGVLAQNLWIDPQRLGVTGGSYGGFMTNWVIGHTTRFAAAASQRSISNWISMSNMADIGYFFGPDQTASSVWGSMEKMWSQSPLAYANRVKTPTLFIHSRQDYRCPEAEGLQMYTALQTHGVPTRMCLFEGENHELSRSGKPANRKKRLEEMTEWFERYLKA